MAVNGECPGNVDELRSDHLKVVELSETNYNKWNSSYFILFLIDGRLIILASRFWAVKIEM